ncbi:MAG: hypothetical protein MUF48_18740, partial [Pirellulaceae bacterium]|nr:hypothetical protein [Pirellulaceae bacterium]
MAQYNGLPTKDVDIHVQRDDLPRARAAALSIGIDYFEGLGVGMFLERDDPSPICRYLVAAGPTQASGNSSGPKARYNLCRWRKPPVSRRINDDQARRADTISPVSALRAWRSSHSAFDRGLST